MKRERLTVILVTLLAASVVGAGFLGLIHNYGKEYFLCKEPPVTSPPSFELLQKFLKAIDDNNQEAALICAQMIISSEDTYEFPPENYLTLFERLGISFGYLNSPFDESDYRRWRQIHQAQEISEHINNESDMLLTIRDHAALAADIAFQAHYALNILESVDYEGNVMKTYFELTHNGKTINIDIDELEKWDGQTGISVNDITENGKYAARLAYPYHLNDFKFANQRLYKILRSVTNLILPDFPEDPFQSFEREKKLFFEKNNLDGNVLSSEEEARYASFRILG